MCTCPLSKIWGRSYHSFWMQLPSFSSFLADSFVCVDLRSALCPGIHLVKSIFWHACAKWQFKLSHYLWTATSSTAQRLRFGSLMY
ncbi:hypothetical protein DUNSADRAFT_3430 [Dunaliella salina]|uniref:Uncharacterized protein n=1 Tax=Dunaliella salina TaxID=3046 RepID=A0ABQ7GTW9_DUNSA|nr:hypothetical protein DUNSADRAFT_3430 [Dunaliella salina]|eukprot:KAF5838061.1 hypothetical protein DUNSADRAFT_3430 [Dunaliella salina]